MPLRHLSFVNVKSLDAWILLAKRFGDKPVGNVETHCLGIGFGDQARTTGDGLPYRSKHAASDAGSARVLAGSYVQDHDLGGLHLVAHHANQIVSNRCAQQDQSRVLAVLLNNAVSAVLAAANGNSSSSDTPSSPTSAGDTCTGRIVIATACPDITSFCRWMNRAARSRLNAGYGAE